MALSRSADFLKGFMLGKNYILIFILINLKNLIGYELNDAIALLRLDDLYIESFEVKDGKFH